MNKTSLLLASGFALATALATPVFASDTILFDPDGTGGANGAIAIGAFDWSVGSSLVNEAIPIDSNSLPTDVEVFTHASLQGFQDTGGNALPAPTGLNGTFEITFITALTETITNISSTTPTCSGGGVGQTCSFQSTILLSESANPTVNVIQLYYDDLTDGSGQKSDALTGLGYNDGQLILEATLSTLDGNFTSTFNFTDNDGDGAFDPLVDTVTSTLFLDSFGDDDWGGQLTVQGNGGTDLDAFVTSQDSTFFISELETLVAALFYNTSNIIPFNQTNPSNSFDDGSGGTISTGGGGLDIGNINGFDGPDLLLQTDANTSFQTAVPEPNTVLLFALGLLFLGFVGRSRYLGRN